MTIPTEPRTTSLYHASELATGSVFSAGRAIAVVLAAFGGFIVASTLVVGANAGLILAVVAGEAMLVLVPLAFVLSQKGNPTKLGLRRPEGRLVVAALLIGASQWFVNLTVVELIDHWIGLPSDGIERLESVAVAPSLGISLFAVALMPAIGEEILFRGVLARGLATRFVPAVAIIASAIVFSAFHMSLVQAAPTFLLGLVYGYLALHARSCVPTMIAHLVNNTLAILVANGNLPWLSELLANNMIAGIAIALAMTSAGLVLAGRSRT